MKRSKREKYFIKKRKIQSVSKLLMNRRRYVHVVWPWLSEAKGKRLHKKRANKFFLFCILDYQMNVEVIRRNVEWLAEEYFKDPNDIWRRITRYSKVQWMSKRKEFNLHRYPKAHERVWRIAKLIVSDYGGDARNIWRRQKPDIVLKRLKKLRVGQQISRMVVGALIDTKQIHGKADVKADTHVTMVLGRIFTGKRLSTDEATELTRKMKPSNPWLLDEPLYFHGRDYCFSRNPNCGECYLRRLCIYCKKYY